MLERVQKFLSSAGVASRRQAEEFIKSGQVFINGKKGRLGDKVDPARDVVKVYGKVVKPAEEKIYLIMNKPSGVVVSRKDPRGRKTVFNLLPADLRTKVWTVGRLDFDTQGLLIFTNDGELTQKLAHPKYEHGKEYEVTTDVKPSERQLEKLREGVKISQGKSVTMVGADTIHPLRENEHTVGITIHEGKHRQIKRMFNAVGLGVINLKRIRVSKLALPANLPVGKYQQIVKADIL